MQGRVEYSRTEGMQAGNVYPRFFIEAVQDELGSAAAGRPLFKNEERVELLMPGIAAYTRPVMRVTQEHIQKWPEAYHAFKSNMEAPLDGTPLEEWPVLTKAHVLELKALHIRTVEDIAHMSDTGLQKIGMGAREMQDKARAYLDDADRMKLTEQQSAEIDRLSAENASLQRQVKEQGEMMQRLHSDVMALREQRPPQATYVPGMNDPMQNYGRAAADVEMREPAASSLAAFADSKKPRRGRGADAEQGA